MKDKNFLKGIVVGVACAMIAGIASCVGIFQGITSESGFFNVDFLRKLMVIENLIEENYIEETEDEMLQEGIFSGLMYGLKDPYSAYYTVEEHEQESTSSDGSYVGIGILMQQNTDGGIKVVECYEGAPGEQAGLKAGDVICAVDGEDVTDKTTTEVADMIRGSDAKHVILTISREEEKDMIDIDVPITDVEIKSVFYELLEEDIGYIRITQFTGVTCEQYKNAFEELEKLGMKKLIVDLRNNPGGLLSSVCDILEEVLPEGLIVYTESKDGTREEFTCEGKNPIEIPLVVLVNGDSASASEIFAGAVKDHKVGTIMGTTTFGKGIVQSVITLYDESAIKMTTAKYYTPNGNDIHGVGVEPDIVVEVDDKLLGREEISTEEDNQIQEAIEYLNK